MLYRRELDYGKYDRLFALSEARDSEEAIFSVALTRLRYPWKLEDAAKLRYENYVKAHMEGIGESCIHAVKERREIAAGDPQEVLLFCCREHYFDEQALGKTITYAPLHNFHSAALPHLPASTDIADASEPH